MNQDELSPLQGAESFVHGVGTVTFPFEAWGHRLLFYLDFIRQELVSP